MLCRSGCLPALHLFLPHVRTLSHPRRTLATTPAEPMSTRQRKRPKKEHGPTPEARNHWNKLDQELSQQLRKIEEDNNGLIVGSLTSLAHLILTLFLTSVKRAIAEEKSQRLRLVANFNICSAIATEHIVRQANLNLEKGVKSPVEIQSGIDEMAKLNDFEDALSKEVKTRKLELEDVKACVQHIYLQLSKHARGNNGKIVIREGDHTVNEVAALVAIFRRQEELGNGISWREEPPTAKGE
ncbi:hypothetical protein HOY80DRAFT_1107960 [Tuber brumale]|nr:hypothetical protein HOY80DRAFT_1107960 [Tuber brumale]